MKFNAKEFAIPPASSIPKKELKRGTRLYNKGLEKGGGAYSSAVTLGSSPNAERG